MSSTTPHSHTPEHLQTKELSEFDRLCRFKHPARKPIRIHATQAIQLTSTLCTAPNGNLNVASWEQILEFLVASTVNMLQATNT